MKKVFKLFFIGKEEYAGQGEGIVPWKPFLVKEWEGESFHLETAAILFLRGESGKYIRGKRISHLNSKKSAFSLELLGDGSDYVDRDFFVINAYDKEGNLLNADKKDEFWRI